MEDTIYDEDLSCSIHVDAAIARAHLCDGIAQVLGGQVHLSTITSVKADISVYPNLTFDLSQRTHSRDDFWFYRYYLTVDVRLGASRADAIALVSQLLQYLWTQGWEAVTTSPYDDDLPQGGGYQR